MASSFNNSAFNFFSNLLNNLTRWSEGGQERKLMCYQIKRQKRRYKRFNDEKKHPRIYKMRANRDARFYNRLRLPPARKGNYYVPGNNTLFGSLYNGYAYRWFEILANWLIVASALIIVIYAIAWGVHRSSSQSSLNAFTITEIVSGFIFVVSIFAKIFFAMFPPKKLYLDNLQANSSQTRFGGIGRGRRRRGFRN